MNKTELIAAVAERSGHTKHDTAILMDAVFTVIEESLLNGSEVKVPCLTAWLHPCIFT